MANTVTIDNDDELTVVRILVPPRKGVNVGGGQHVIIPDDWQELIAAGKHVPGVFNLTPAQDTGEIDLLPELESRIMDTSKFPTPPGLSNARAALQSKVTARSSRLQTQRKKK